MPDPSSLRRCTAVHTHHTLEGLAAILRLTDGDFAELVRRDALHICDTPGGQMVSCDAIAMLVQCALSMHEGHPVKVLSAEVFEGHLCEARVTEGRRGD